MAEQPWVGDTCSLVDAFRAGERSPAEELEATLAAIEASDLNAFSFVDADRARDAARRADVRQPFGGVPVGVKELEAVAGWPSTEASLIHRDRISPYTSTAMERLRDEGGAVLVGQTTASEFGGLNVSTTKLNGTTGNAWDPARTAGGSSGGSSAAVAGGLVTIASGGDGGGSIRIPASFNGLVGMKGTAGRIPRGPRPLISPLTVVVGCVARSVRDVARWYDVTSGYDSRDPYSLPKIDGWERDLGTRLPDLRGRKVAILPDLCGSAVVRPAVAELVREAGEALAKDVGLEIVDGVSVEIPDMGIEWAFGNLAGLSAEIGELWPDCRDDLTPEIAFGLTLAKEHYSLDMAGAAELKRMRCNEAVADLFDEVDFVICSTNPDVAFPAEISVNTKVGDLSVGIENNLALTGPFNLVGNPSCSVPIGLLTPWSADGDEAAPGPPGAQASAGAPDAATALPVGMQLVGRHHADAALLDLALAVERERPWPLVAVRV
jgi:aspartyl-tRNA(Asn)/glutamyl-tRNA(Gln) amidotransferase subunit A